MANHAAIPVVVITGFGEIVGQATPAMSESSPTEFPLHFGVSRN
jgi:hypothetical protein